MLFYLGSDCDGGTEGKFCTFDLTAVTLPYTETFTVTAKPGYRFVKWQKAADFKCGDSTDPACTITASDNELGRVIMASFWTGYLMPVFEYLGVDTDGDGVLDPHDADDDNDGLDDSLDNCPLTWPNDDGYGCPEPLPDSIIANGKEWAQPLTFVNLSWEQVYEVCPPVHGLSLCKGQLNGIDLRGWRWATTAEVSAHMQSYAGTGGGCEKITNDFKFVKIPSMMRARCYWVGFPTAVPISTSSLILLQFFAVTASLLAPDCIPLVLAVGFIDSGNEDGTGSSIHYLLTTATI